MEYPRYELRGRRECPWCRCESREEWTIVDPLTGRTVGRRTVKIACGCRAYEDQRGEVLSDEDELY